MIGLQTRSWYQLRASAQAVQMPFDTRWTKQEAFHRLSAWLTTHGNLQRCLKRLPQRERRALQALQAAGGVLPRAQFTRHFGTVRPCRQRHPVSKGAIWRYPASPAERLWLYGFVEILPSRPEQIALTDEALALLPPLPVPLPRADVSAEDTVWTRAALVRDLAIWLGGLLGEQPRPLHGRWLASRMVRAINRRLPQPEMLDALRSELGAGRLRGLHYLAESAGLVASVGDALQPTPAAWRWLALPFQQQWTQVWTALEADRRAGADSLWQRYRLPEVTDAGWTALVRWLERLTPGIYDFESLLDALRPYCPLDPNRLDAEGELRDGIAALLDTVFAWIGWARRVDDVVEVFAAADRPEQLAALTITPDRLTITLPAHPVLLPLVQALAWAQAESLHLLVDAAAVRRAVAQGVTGLQIAETLAALCGTLPEALLAQLRAWEREARALQLRSMWVLTADDPAALDAICADRGLRTLIDAPLSAHHLAVRADQAEPLCRKLERRGQPVTHHRETEIPAGVGAATAAYAYLAVRVFQGLGDFAGLPTRIPAAARESLAAQITTAEADALDQMAARVQDALARAMQGEVAAPPIESEQSENVRAVLRRTYEQRQSVSIDYFSPARWAITTRRIEPLRWYERGGATYVEAWCELDGAARTFRLDRVLCVHPPADADKDRHSRYPF